MTTKASLKFAALNHHGKNYLYVPLSWLSEITGIDLAILPYSIRVLAEGELRNALLHDNPEELLEPLVHWLKRNQQSAPYIFGFHPGRVLLQDLTGVPVLVDLASMRSSYFRKGLDPQNINPQIPVDLVIDHSIQVDFFGSNTALSENTKLEFTRNQERYVFLKWAQNAFTNLRIVPPSRGIVHQVNLEYLAPVVQQKRTSTGTLLFPDTVVGTDSHTTMINGLGVLGWGVGGIEAIAAMLGQPIEVPFPEVVGVRVIGELPVGSTPTDIVLTLTNQLRQLGVVNKIVEFTGPGLIKLSVYDRAMLANMAPEYGATAAYFPMDEQSLHYLKETGRSDEHIDLIKAYYKKQGLFREEHSIQPHFDLLVTLDLDSIQPSLAGPKRPQDLVSLKKIAANFKESLAQPISERGYGLSAEQIENKTQFSYNNKPYHLQHGSVVLAAITSCTNTSNPTAIITAALLARNALEAGLQVAPYIKTSFAPGSRVVVSYLQKAGLMEFLENLGFNLVGFGCTTCIGNSGPLPEEVSEAIDKNHLITAGVLSGNRNFEGRIHPLVQANYLASPALVVAYALAGNINGNLINSPLGENKDGSPVFLKDIWPGTEEVQGLIRKVIQPELYRQNYAEIFDGDALWQKLPSTDGSIYPWDQNSTYLRETPFSDLQVDAKKDEIHARALAVFGNSITTDHISPAGSISTNSPASQYLQGLGVQPAEFNSYGSRRGNHEVMVRGTFANIRLQNKMLNGKSGGKTIYIPDNEEISIFDAAMEYHADNMDLIILAGKEYGTGSSRDWAAKGPLLLGVKVVIAESFERIHRSNLVGMGILPLQFVSGENVQSLGLTGFESFTISGLSSLAVHSQVSVKAMSDTSVTTFNLNALLNSKYEVDCIHNGGIFRMLS